MHKFYTGVVASTIFEKFIAPMCKVFLGDPESEDTLRDEIEAAKEIVFGVPWRTIKTYKLTKTIKPFPGHFKPAYKQQILRKFPPGTRIVAVFDKRTPSLIAVSVFNESISKNDWRFDLTPHQFKVIAPRLQEVTRRG